MIATYRRLGPLPNEVLFAMCRRLSDEWERKGRPDDADMPREMLFEKDRLAVELARRGYQLTLF